MNNPRSELMRRRPRTGSPVKDEALFLAHLEVIDAAIAQVCRRNHLSTAEAGDFASEVHLRLLERQGDPLKRFEGRSSLHTYLVVVVQRLYLDYRNRQWGKWRPSAEARRLGPLAVLVERLVVREGYTFDQVSETLRTNYRVEVTDAIREFYVKVAGRMPARQFVAESEAVEVPSGWPPPGENVLRAEQGFRAKQVRTMLDRLKQALPAEDQVILRMHFEDGFRVADIARTLQLNQKRLYPRLEQLLARLRDGLIGAGIGREEVRALLAEGWLDAVDTDESQEERKRTSWPKR